jgi:pseudouridine-5'-phosphate glycosidase
MIPDLMMFSPAVSQALKTNVPVVALESAVITHGFPKPDNLSLARALEDEISTGGADPVNWKKWRWIPMRIKSAGGTSLLR